MRECCVVSDAYVIQLPLIELTLWLNGYHGGLLTKSSQFESPPRLIMLVLYCSIDNIEDIEV